jgi:hypothetical protein
MKQQNYDERTPQAGEGLSGQREGTQPEPGVRAAVEKTASQGKIKVTNDDNTPDVPEANLSPANGELARQGMDIPERPVATFANNAMENLPETTSVSELVSQGRKYGGY